MRLHQRGVDFLNPQFFSFPNMSWLFCDIVLSKVIYNFVDLCKKNSSEVFENGEMSIAEAVALSYQQLFSLKPKQLIVFHCSK